MIPILFEHGETQFNTNGICRLPDCTKCLVTEAVNGVYECEFQYPVTGRHFSDIIENRIIYTTHDDSRIPQPFDIYRHTIPIDGLVTFYARHISYRLSFVVVEPYSAGSCTLAFAQIKQKSINTNPFTFTTTVIRTADFELGYPVSARALLGGMEKSLIDTFGGEIEWDKFTVKHSARRGRETSIELRYGKNITDINYDFDDGGNYTAVVPYWRSNDGDLIAMLPDKIVTREGAGSEKTVALDVSRNYDDIPVDEDLIAEAQKALVVSPNVNIKVKFFELWNTEEYELYAQLQRAYLGDTVSIKYTAYGITDSQRVVKTVYDSLLDRYDSMELGQIKQSFGSELRSRVENAVIDFAPSKSAMQAAIEHATNLITGGLGGNVVHNYNADGQPIEILVMDTDNKETAVNVMRINIKGIGFSQTGYEGPFTSAWTLDGHFVADFITTGNLNAALLTAGVIMGANGHNWFDLENDTVHLAVGSFTLVDAEGRTTTIAAQALDGITQLDAFNKLTNNGLLDGIFMENGQLYINLSYLRSGTFEVTDRNGNRTLSINGDTGAIDMIANSFSLTGGQTIQTIADTAASNAVNNYRPQDHLTQLQIFNLLTNNQTIQGLYMEDGKLYINFSYGKGGVLQLGTKYRSDNVTEEDFGQLECYALGRLRSRITYQGMFFYYDNSQSKRGVKIDQGLINIQAESGTDQIYIEAARITAPNDLLISVSYGDLIMQILSGDIVFKTLDNGIFKCQMAMQATDITASGTISCRNLSVTNPPWTTSSDRKLKKNIEDAEDQTENVRKLKTHSFDWKDGSGHVHVGLVAQELQEVYPELVLETEKGLAIDYINMVPYLLKTIQEQEERITLLSKEIEQMKKSIRAARRW